MADNIDPESIKRGLVDAHSRNGVVTLVWDRPEFSAAKTLEWMERMQSQPSSITGFICLCGKVEIPVTATDVIQCEQCGRRYAIAFGRNGILGAMQVQEPSRDA